MAKNYTAGDEPIPGSGYRLREFLGRGGFGEVWKAHGPGGVEVALKIIHLGGVAGRKEFRALQLVKRIHHPGAVPIVAFWLKAADGSVLDDDCSSWEELAAPVGKSGAIAETAVAPPDLGKPQAAELVIAMGLGDISLFDRMRQCQEQGRAGIEEDELLGYLESAAKAIDYLNSPIHDLGSGPVAIQHCDIKPQNILIVGNATQVCDFGLARIMGTERATTTAATIAYAAPECLTTGNPSGATDQYSLAVSYYELRTGRLPYDNEAPGAVMDAKLNETLDFSAVSPAQQAVLRRATSRDPAARFGSCSELIAALRDTAGDGLARTTVYEPAAARVSRPRRAAKYFATAVLLVLAGTAVWYYVYREPGKEIPSVAKGGKTKDVKPLPEVDYLASGTKALEDWKAKHLKEESPPDKSPAAMQAWQSAVDDFTRAVEHSPESALAYSRRGRAYYYLQEWNKAVADLSKAVNLEPDSSDCIRLGKAYTELEKPQDAIEAYKRAVEIDPENADAFSALGGFYFDQQQESEAIKYLEKAESLYENGGKTPEQVGVLWLLAGSLQGEGRDDDSIQSLTKIARLDPSQKAECAIMCIDSAEGYAEAEQFDAAVKWAEKAVEFAPDEAKKKQYEQKRDEYKKHK